MTYTFRTLIVTDDEVTHAREQFAEAMLAAGENMFITPLYDVADTVTHWISSGSIEVEYADMLPLNDPAPTPYNPTPTPFNGEPVQWRETIQDNGYTVPAGQVTQMFNGLDSTTADPHVRIADLGLSLQGPGPVPLPVPVP